jgi:hypothetical protein
MDQSGRRATQMIVLGSSLGASKTGADPAGACGHHVRHTASLSSPDRSALLLRIIPSFWRVSLELLEKTVFPFASRPRL